MIPDLSYLVRGLSALCSLLGYCLLQNIGLAYAHVILPFKACAIYCFSSLGGLNISVSWVSSLHSVGHF